MKSNAELIILTGILAIVAACGAIGAYFLFDVAPLLGGSIAGGAFTMALIGLVAKAVLDNIEELRSELSNQISSQKSKEEDSLSGVLARMPEALVMLKEVQESLHTVPAIAESIKHNSTFANLNKAADNLRTERKALETTEENMRATIDAGVKALDDGRLLIAAENATLQSSRKITETAISNLSTVAGSFKDAGETATQVLTGFREERAEQTRQQTKLVSELKEQSAVTSHNNRDFNRIVDRHKGVLTEAEGVIKSYDQRMEDIHSHYSEFRINVDEELSKAERVGKQLLENGAVLKASAIQQMFDMKKISVRTDRNVRKLEDAAIQIARAGDEAATLIKTSAEQNADRIESAGENMAAKASAAKASLEKGGASILDSSNEFGIKIAEQADRVKQDVASTLAGTEQIISSVDTSLKSANHLVAIQRRSASVTMGRGELLKDYIAKAIKIADEGAEGVITKAQSMISTAESAVDDVAERMAGIKDEAATVKTLFAEIGQELVVLEETFEGLHETGRKVTRETKEEVQKTYNLSSRIFQHHQSILTKIKAAREEVDAVLKAFLDSGTQFDGKSAAKIERLRKIMDDTAKLVNSLEAQAAATEKAYADNTAITERDMAAVKQMKDNISEIGNDILQKLSETLSGIKSAESNLTTRGNNAVGILADYRKAFEETVNSFEVNGARLVSQLSDSDEKLTSQANASYAKLSEVVSSISISEHAAFSRVSDAILPILNEIGSQTLSVLGEQIPNRIIDRQMSGKDPNAIAEWTISKISRANKAALAKRMASADARQPAMEFIRHFQNLVKATEASDITGTLTRIIQTSDIARIAAILELAVTTEVEAA